MSDDSLCWCVAPWCVALVAATFGMLMLSAGVTLVEERNALRADAVRRGYAEFVVGKDNTVEFRWKP